MSNPENYGLDGRSPCPDCGGADNHILGCPAITSVADLEAMKEAFEAPKTEVSRNHPGRGFPRPDSKMDTDSQRLTPNQEKTPQTSEGQVSEKSQIPKTSSGHWDIAEMMSEKCAMNDWFHKKFNDSTAGLKFADQKAVFIVRQIAYAFFRQGVAHGYDTAKIEEQHKMSAPPESDQTMLDSGTPGV